MSDLPDDDPQLTVSALRAAFDRTFALPPAAAPIALTRLLALRVGAQPLACRLDQIQGLERTRTLLLLPGAPRALRGLMGLRGQLLPVWSLALLLGEENPGDEPWLLCRGGASPLGLSFSLFEGHLEVEAGALLPASRRYLAGQVRHDGAVRGVLDLAALANDVCTPGIGPGKEP